MAIFKIDDIRAAGKRAAGLYKTAASVLNEGVQNFSASKEYDIFLSHSFKDAELVLGIKARLEGHGHSVYVDWIEDPSLDRSQISSKTADVLKLRMNCCKSLFYSTTESSSSSKWMPWECGYLDGKYGKVAILPLSNSGTNSFSGQEYLGIYPYVTEEATSQSSKNVLWVNESPDTYCTFSAWLSGLKPKKH